ncbi:hypothetical protein SB49_02670 [Sediminicola sp. YIK13]|uniref:hypothetical protein n=1 Tax=Sediminicola sp. YIK13 TaxID=1453352 RepID=UPI000722D4F1|nr:hypothetical protein [Sediminicola sp. YIK13]ALM06826.1 hypothetical protein SB49_02670 [Sediminicola sp. YIK13]
METKLEYVLTHSHKAEMISYMNSHPEFYDEAIHLAIADKQPYSWRAAWLLWSCIEQNDPRVQNHIQRILDNISNKPDGHQRELIKILLEMDLNEEQEGYLYDLCVSLWKQTEKKPSVRFTAFKYIRKIAHKYPELNNELVLLAQEKYLESLSPTAKKSILKLLN